MVTAMTPTVPAAIRMPVVVVVLFTFNVIDAFLDHGYRLPYDENRRHLADHGNPYLFDYSAAALHRLIGRTARRHAVAHHGTRRCADRGCHGPAVATADLVAEKAAGNATDNRAADTRSGRLHWHLFIPAFLTRTLDHLEFRGIRRQRQCKQQDGTRKFVRHKATVGFD
jgi:hypothetical protein